MATVKFLIRSTAKNADKFANIQCRFRDSTIDFFAPTGLKTQAAYWGSKKEKVKNPNKATYAHDVNLKLSEIKAHVLAQYATLTDAPGKDWLKTTIDKFNNPEKYERKPKTLFEYIESYLQNDPETTKKGGYDRVYYFLQQYASHIKKPIDFGDITLDFYFDFKDYLTKQKRLSVNYVAKNIKILKVFLNAAKEDGYNKFTHYQTRRFKAEQEEIDSFYLSETEIQQLYETDFAGNELREQIRDIFIVGCWTGLRYSDWNKVTSENIEDDFIVLNQQKTGAVVVIPLHEMVKTIIKKYNGVLPSFGKEKINLEMKHIAKKAGLNETFQATTTKAGITRTVTYAKHEKISTHTARRSFATCLYKAGLPSYTIMQITGHKTETAFLKYIKVTPREHAQKLKEFWQNRPLMKIAN